MALLVLLSDRAPEAALPALADLRFDLKVESLSVDSLAHVRELEPAAAMVDAGENPGQAWSVLPCARRTATTHTDRVRENRRGVRCLPAV